jgi:hypothetical protein
MPILVECTGCHAKLKAADGLAGKTAKCPHCGTMMVVPGAPAADDGPSRVLVPAPAPLITAPLPSTMRANRQVAGRTCGLCNCVIALGAEVRNCEHCQASYHQACWTNHGGCATIECPGAPLPSLQAPASADSGPIPFQEEESGPPAQAPAPAALVACRACGESFDATAAQCPYCHELVLGYASNLPRSFQAKHRGKQWNFVLDGADLVGQNSRGQRVVVPRAQAHQSIFMKKKTFQVVSPENPRPMTFRTDDVGMLAVEYFSTGQANPRVCSKATSALWTSILGFLCCGVIVGPLAIAEARKAKTMIRQYPRYLTGEGYATAGFVIGIIVTCLSGLAIIIQVIAAAGQAGR